MLLAAGDSISACSGKHWIYNSFVLNYLQVMNQPAQFGSTNVQIPSDPQVREPDCLQHEYVAVLPYVVPSVVFTSPSSGSTREPQLTTLRANSSVTFF